MEHWRWLPFGSDTGFGVRGGRRRVFHAFQDGGGRDISAIKRVSKSVERDRHDVEEERRSPVYLQSIVASERVASPPRLQPLVPPRGA